MTRMHNHIQFVQETRWIDDAEERAALIGKIDAAAGHDVDVNELTETAAGSLRIHSDGGMRLFL